MEVGHHEVEVEGLVQLVGADVAGQPLGRGHPRLGHGHPPAGVGVEDRPPLAVDVVHAVLVEVRQLLIAQHLGLRAVLRPHVGQPGGLDHAVRHVDAEAVHAAVQPEAQDVTELGAYQGCPS